MDQVRWLVVVSVIFCMIITLTLLQKYSYRQPHSGDPAEINVADTMVQEPENKKMTVKKAGNSLRRYREVKFSRPAAHTFSLEGQGAFSTSEKLIQNEGKIVE